VTNWLTPFCRKTPFSGAIIWVDISDPKSVGLPRRANRTGNVAAESGPVPLRFVIINQMMLGVVNPFFRDYEKTALHLGKFDILSAANFACVFRKPFT